MCKRGVIVATILACVLLAVVLLGLADPPPWMDCWYSGQECHPPWVYCFTPIGIPGIAKTCYEQWYCPEYYWESCGTCFCFVVDI
jgi:hypothetical protein